MKHFYIMIPLITLCFISYGGKKEELPEALLKDMIENKYCIVEATKEVVEAPYGRHIIRLPKEYEALQFKTKKIKIVIILKE